MMRLAAINNLSGRTYRLCPPPAGHSLVFETPAGIEALVRSGRCDAALLPVALWPDLTGMLDRLGRYGIACTGPVQSVQLFTNFSVEQLLRTGLPIYVTPETRTSVQLLRVLCQQQFGDVPQFTDVEAEAPAHLLIGGAALDCARTLSSSRQAIDLGAWWMAQTGLPFVFAQWVVSKSIGLEERGRIVAWLADCVQAASRLDRAGMAGIDAQFGLAAYHQAIRSHLSR